MSRYLITVLLVTLFSLGSQAQMFVQLEVFNSAKVIKYAPGQKITFKTKDIPDSWQNGTIETIKYAENMIVFTRGIVSLDDITHVKRRNSAVYALSRSLYVFSLTSIVYGGIGSLATGTLSPGLLIFTLPPAAFAFFLDKVVTTKVYAMDKNSRLRLLDLRMYD